MPMVFSVRMDGEFARENLNLILKACERRCLPTRNRDAMRYTNPGDVRSRSTVVSRKEKAQWHINIRIFPVTAQVGGVS